MTGLEALEHIAKDDFNMIITTYPPKKAFNGITEGEMIEIIRKELKAFEIIKDKVIPFVSVEENLKDKKFYVTDLDYYRCLELTKEEYDLLKEILKDEN